jgi:SAM-dependent methyltransferase
VSDRTKPDRTNIARARYDALADKIERGASHASLGPNLKEKDDWWGAGQPKFRKIRKMFPIGRKDRVIEYGCGSLRVGAHFIRHLDPGCYFGLDLTAKLIDFGKKLLGEDILREKAPRLAAIDDGSLADATNFAARFVFSWAVAFHVHPDENAYYLETLARLAHKRGSVLFFNTKLADTEFKYGSSGWARPLDMYRKALSSLNFVKMHNARAAEEGDKSMGSTSAVLEFRRE